MRLETDVRGGVLLRPGAATVKGAQGSSGGPTACMDGQPPAIRSSRTRALHACAFPVRVEAQAGTAAQTAAPPSSDGRAAGMRPGHPAAVRRAAAGPAFRFFKGRARACMAMSASTISLHSCSSGVCIGSQPSTRLALAGLPSSRSTCAPVEKG